jgi:hypothetical protein
MATQVPVPGSVSAMALLDRCSYEDAFGVAVAETRAPGVWARLVVDEAPAPLVWFIRLAQRKLLGLELGPDGARQPLGWTVVREDEEAMVLAAEGRGGSARIIGTTPPGQVVVTTQARFDSRRSRAVWWLLAPVHRRVARYLLDNAVGKAGAGSGQRSSFT